MIQKPIEKIIAAVLIVGLLVGCTPSAPVSPTQTSRPTPSSAPTVERRADGLTQQQAATLGSLEKIDEYPLYTLRYYGAYAQRETSTENKDWLERVDIPGSELKGTIPSWACSLFAALGKEGDGVFGRNFDWQFSPAVLLFTDPPDGYASVSMVDIAYLGFGADDVGVLTDLPLIEREALLDAPFLPFDGMNERGLVVGMAAVPPGQMQPDPDKETIDSLMVIRKMLDQADTVDEALSVIRSYNIDWGSGPPLHYLIADSSGASALVEFYQGETIVTQNEKPWHLATNFIRASAGELTQGTCWRYDRIHQRLDQSDGSLSTEAALNLLEDVAQQNTQWSLVYHIDTGNINVVMARQFDNVYRFSLRQEE